MRLIDADTFVNMQMFDPEREEWYTERMTIAECLDNYADEGCPPTIDGEWIDMGDFEQCSVCKGTHLKEFQSYYGKTIWVKTPYCPSCGAQMKGADDEKDI